MVYPGIHIWGTQLFLGSKNTLEEAFSGKIESIAVKSVPIHVVKGMT